MSQLEDSPPSKPPVRGRVPLLTGIIFVSILLMSATEVRKGADYLNPLKEVLSPIREAMEASYSGQDLKEVVASSEMTSWTSENQDTSSNNKAMNKYLPSEQNISENQHFPKDEILASESPEKEEDESQPTKLDKNTIAKGSSYEHTHEPLNILLLYGDDWRHDSIGAAGTQIVRTPFIDQLARDGIRFTHNCVTTSVCWISRATLYTGQFMSRHNTTYPHSPYWYARWGDTFPAKLREAGYYLGQVGKWHFHNWNEFAKDKFHVAKNYHGKHWYGDEHTTKRSERDGIEFLKNRPKDKPFMLSVCFFAPHSVDNSAEQYEPQPESMSLYENETVVKPVSNTLEAWDALPSVFTIDNEGRRRWEMRFEKDGQYQKMMKNYFRLISEVDESSRKIVDELERQGVMNNTMIIFTTDNGYFHAEHGLAGKWYPHQESIRVPLVILDPRMPKDKVGTLNEEFTLNIDLASTILGAAGLPQPASMQGRDIADLYLAEGEEWRDEFFYEHPVHIDPDLIPESSALVRKDFKFMRWPGGPQEQLFDLKADPLELNDLINSKEHEDVVTEMRRRHDELQIHVQ
jgi:arylsulfatase